MTLRQTIPAYCVILLLVLTGCYRSSNDTFESVDGLNDVAEQSVDVSPTTSTTLVEITQTPTVDAGFSQPTDEVEAEAPTETDLNAESADETTTITEADATATETVPLIVPTNTLQPPTNTPIPLPTDEPEVLSTATDPVIITPEAPPSQLTINTPEPTEEVELTPDPTEAPVDDDATTADAEDTSDEVEEVSEECQYQVQSGDNPFRIALNNGTTLAALLEANNLSSDPILQPGQTLIIPDCDPTDTETATDTDTDTDTETTADPIDEDTAASGDFIIHAVTSGETLSGIAARYGVSVQQIVAENDLINPDSLSVGQQLRIPN